MFRRAPLAIERGPLGQLVDGILVLLADSLEVNALRPHELFGRLAVLKGRRGKKNLVLQRPTLLPRRAIILGHLWNQRIFHLVRLMDELVHINNQKLLQYLVFHLF